MGGEGGSCTEESHPLHTHRFSVYLLSPFSGGFLPHIIARPILVDILTKLVPKHKILYSKKILSCKQDEEGVIIACSDNSSYQAEIVIGADGAYSGVRQNLYKQMAAQGRLPKGDGASLPFNSTCLVGQTRPLDPEVFPHLKDNHTWFETIIGEDKPYAVSQPVVGLEFSLTERGEKISLSPGISTMPI